MKGYNRRLAVDPFEEKAPVKDNSFRKFIAFLIILAIVIFFVL